MRDSDAEGVNASQQPHDSTSGRAGPRGLSADNGRATIEFALNSSQFDNVVRGKAWTR